MLEKVTKKEPQIYETLFNWNTTGAFSVLNVDAPGRQEHVQILASLNSGSLPIIYKDEHQPEFDDIFAPFEEEGYQYFRSLRDPLLAREVSYQVIFQATRDHPLPTALPTPSLAAKAKPMLWRKISKLLEQPFDISKFSEAEITKLCEAASQAGLFDSGDDCARALTLNQLSSEFYTAGNDQFRSLIVNSIIDRNSVKGDPDVSEKDVLNAIDL